MCEHGFSTWTVKAPVPNVAVSHVHTQPFQFSQQFSGPGPDLIGLVKEVWAPGAFALSCLSAGFSREAIEEAAVWHFWKDQHSES